LNEYVLDIEANDLIQHVSKAWIIGWKDVATGRKIWWPDGDLGWQSELDKADIVIGHNLAGYDLPLLEEVFGYRLPKNVRIRDTLIISQVLDYRRLESHSLASWGAFLGNPKGEWSDFSQWSPGMHTYWEQDLDLTEQVYKYLLPELEELLEKGPSIAYYLKAENAVARWCALAERRGWPFNKDAGIALLAAMEAEKLVCSNRLLPRLGTKVVPVDKEAGEVEFKMPKWVKSGAYNHHTANWFGIDALTGQDDDRLVEGPYSRIEVHDLKITSVSDVKIFLNRIGWIPTEWNFKVDPENPRKKIKTSPKITEDSLECLDGDGKLYCDFLTTSSRASILKNWIEGCDENNRLHGKCFPIGTPSMRARHAGIVNVPAAESIWGKEMRALFTCPSGKKLIGCDSAGNQARGLAHYLKSEEFTHQLINGDIHTFNANALDEVLRYMGVSWNAYLKKIGIVADDKYTQEENFAKRKRAAAKRILYAFLFGASGAKLWSYIFGVLDPEQGNRLKNGFIKAVPGFEVLVKELERIFKRTKGEDGYGFILGIANNKLFCNSPHKLLVYLLQACEKATCAAAIMLTMERLEEAGIEYDPCIFMHDEEDFIVAEEDAEEAAAIGKQAFIDGPKLFKVLIMDGESKIGNNWFEIH
jgi:DNA polymerase-1